MASITKSLANEAVLAVAGVPALTDLILFVPLAGYVAQVTDCKKATIADLFTGGNVTNFAFSGYLEGTEIADPVAPAANKGRIYFKDNGAGKTLLVVRFPTGAVQTVATEP